MAIRPNCNFCGHGLPRGPSSCPHCGQPGRYQNVDDAGAGEEQVALDLRYRSAVADSAARGAEDRLKDFEMAVGKSKAVISRPLDFLQPLAQSDNVLYATYYKLMQAEVRLPEGGKWDILRAVTDEALFTGFKEEIRFAALSLDGVGIFNYGPCSITLREEMISHRASAFEENSVLFMDHRQVLMKDAHDLPKGYRSLWAERAKLCISKLAKSIDRSTQPDEYSGLLIRQGATTDDDHFVEVHIWGGLTRRTMERVIVPRPKNAVERTITEAIKVGLQAVGATLEIR